MARLKTRIIFPIFILIVFTILTYVVFLLEILNYLLNVEMSNKVANIILSSGSTVTALTLILAGLICLFLIRLINQPIKELVKATEAISKRDFDHQIKTQTFSEIEKLVHNFNHMAQQLKSFEQESKIYSQNLEKTVRERTEELSYLYKIGREISFSLELKDVLDTIVKRTSEILKLRICTILLIDPASPERLIVSRAQGINLKRIGKQSIRPGEGISGWVWDKKDAILIKDVDQDPRFIGREKEKYYKGALISVPLEAKGKIIGIINGNNKTNGDGFSQSDLLLLEEIATESAIAIENALLYKNLKDVYVHTISALASALETKDRYARSHSENVTKYAVAIAEKMGLSGPQIEIIRQACLLHDLGKIGIHDYILTKSGKLTAEEWEEIKLHSLRGAQILQPIGFLAEVSDLIKQHHERYDGSGYPLKLREEDIKLGARIMIVADAFDAMISERPYRKALTLQQAITELKENSGTQFDPKIVEVFLKLLKTEPDLVKQLNLSRK